VSELVDLSVRVVELEQSLPEATTARQFLQMVMRGEIEPTPRQMSAAKVLFSCRSWSHGWHELRRCSRTLHRPVQRTTPESCALATGSAQRRGSEEAVPTSQA